MKQFFISLALFILLLSNSCCSESSAQWSLFPRKNCFWVETEVTWVNNKKISVWFPVRDTSIYSLGAYVPLRNIDDDIISDPLRAGRPHSNHAGRYHLMGKVVKVSKKYESLREREIVVADKDGEVSIARTNVPFYEVNDTILLSIVYVGGHPNVTSYKIKSIEGTKELGSGDASPRVYQYKIAKIISIEKKPSRAFLSLQ